MFGLIVVVVAFAFIFGGKKAANTVLKAVAGLIVALIAGTFNLLTAVVRGIFRLPQARPAARRLERHHDDDDED